MQFDKYVLVKKVEELTKLIKDFVADKKVMFMLPALIWLVRLVNAMIILIVIVWSLWRMLVLVVQNILIYPNLKHVGFGDGDSSFVSPIQKPTTT